MSEKQLEQFKEVARVKAVARLDRALELKDTIAAIDHDVLAKITTILSSDGDRNGVCGFGCSASEQIPDVRR